MSIQHRSKIKSAFNYSENLSDFGACCDPHADSAYGSTYLDCISSGGYFQGLEIGDDPTSVVCPDIADVACCCSCSYVENFNEFFSEPDSYMGGISETTFCDCNSKGGIWAGVPCATFDSIELVNSLCRSQGPDNDVRYPAACCVKDQSNNETCYNVCSDVECLEKLNNDPCCPENGEDCEPEQLCGSYQVNSICYEEAVGGYEPADCYSGTFYGPMGATRGRLTGLWNADNITDEKKKEIYHTSVNRGIKSAKASSCVYDEDRTIKCDVLNQKLCETKKGMFAGFDQSFDPYLCDSNRSIGMMDYKKNKKISSSNISEWKIGNDVWNLGTYAGIFYTKSSEHGRGVECEGNSETGSGVSYYSNTNEIEDSGSKKYAIIVAPYEITSASLGTDYNANATNSLWNAILNDTNFSYSNVKKIINNHYDNTHVNWIIPSKDILAFIHKQVYSSEFQTNLKTYNNPQKNFMEFNMGYYWSSSLYKVNNIRYAYVQKFGEKNNTFVSVCNPRNSSHKLRPILMIEIY